jgi:hypothetical protein
MTINRLRMNETLQVDIFKSILSAYVYTNVENVMRFVCLIVTALVLSFTTTQAQKFSWIGKWRGTASYSAASGSTGNESSPSEGSEESEGEYEGDDSGDGAGYDTSGEIEFTISSDGASYLLVGTMDERGFEVSIPADKFIATTKSLNVSMLTVYKLRKKCEGSSDMELGSMYPDPMCWEIARENAQLIGKPTLPEGYQSVDINVEVKVDSKGRLSGIVRNSYRYHSKQNGAMGDWFYSFENLKRSQ